MAYEWHKDPEVTAFDYVAINKGLDGEFKLLIGVWKGEKYIPLHREELEWHLVNRVWDDEPKERYNPKFYKRVARLNG